MIVIPDLHTRRGLLWRALCYRLPGGGQSVLDALLSSELQIVCVGDALHSEGPGAHKMWSRAWREYQRGYSPSPVMDEEMVGGLALLNMVGLLQAECPGRFHFLKGNHENIRCEGILGNHPFYKFASEGEMVFEWLSLKYGAELLETIYRWEHALPLMALGGWYLISHAEPSRGFTPEEVIDAAKSPEVVEGLTWTRKHPGANPAAVETLANFFPGLPVDRLIYLAGHTIVARFRYTPTDRLLLIHDSTKQQGFLLPVVAPTQLAPEEWLVEFKGELP